MKTNVLNLVGSMFDKQDAYDRLIFKEHRKPELPMIECALMDELGELNHELKEKWCWWKHSQKPANWNLVLEEYVDVLHFALCIVLEANDRLYCMRSLETHLKTSRFLAFSYFPKDYAQQMRKIMHYLSKRNYVYLFRAVLELGIGLGFTYQTIYDAYCKKNKVNIERLANGY